MTFEEKFPELKGKHYAFDKNEWIQELLIEFCLSKSFVIKTIKELQNNTPYENTHEDFPYEEGYVEALNKLLEVLEK